MAADNQALWDDSGPISQGKIITAVMQGKIADARQMLHGWTVNDLTSLDAATRALSLLIMQEKTIRRGAIVKCHYCLRPYEGNGQDAEHQDWCPLYPIKLYGAK